MIHHKLFKLQLSVIIFSYNNSSNNSVIFVSEITTVTTTNKYYYIITTIRVRLVLILFQVLIKRIPLFSV